MSEKQDNTVINLKDRKAQKEQDAITDEDFEMFLKAFFGPYRGGYCPE